MNFNAPEPNSCPTTESKNPFYNVTRNQALLLIAALFLWIVLSSHFSSTLIAPEIGSGAFDSLATELLKGYVTVEKKAIGSEMLVVNGKTVMYFGPFPAFIRLPLNTLFPQYRDMWARISSLLAALLATIGYSILIVRRLTSNEHLTAEEKQQLLFLSMLTFILGFPIIFLLSTPVIYHESILWAFAWSMWGMFFLDRLIHAPQAKHPSSYAGFGLSTGLALLSRVSFAIPFLAISPFLLLSLSRYDQSSKDARRDSLHRGTSILLPLTICGLFQCWYNYERFGSILTFIDFNLYSISPNLIGDAFNPGRISTALVNYFGIRPESLGGTFPFVRLASVVMTDPYLFFTNLYREWTCSLILLCPTLILVACLTVIDKLRAGQFGFFLIFAAFFLQSILISCFFFETMRYATEYIPLLILCYATYMGERGAVSLVRNTFFSNLFIALCAVAVYTSLFTTLDWISAPYNWMVSDQSYKDTIGVLLQDLDRLCQEAYAPFEEFWQKIAR